MDVSTSRGPGSLQEGLEKTVGNTLHKLQKCLPVDLHLQHTWPLLPNHPHPPACTFILSTLQIIPEYLLCASHSSRHHRTHQLETTDAQSYGGYELSHPAPDATVPRCQPCQNPSLLPHSRAGNSFPHSSLPKGLLHQGEVLPKALVSTLRPPQNEARPSLQYPSESPR